MDSELGGEAQDGILTSFILVSVVMPASLECFHRSRRGMERARRLDGVRTETLQVGTSTVVGKTLGASRTCHGLWRE